MNSPTDNSRFIPGSNTEIVTALLNDVTTYCNTRGSAVYTCSLDAEGAFVVIRFTRSTSIFPSTAIPHTMDGRTDGQTDGQTDIASDYIR